MILVHIIAFLQIFEKVIFLQESVWVDEVFTTACEGKQVILDEK